VAFWKRRRESAQPRVDADAVARAEGYQSAEHKRRSEEGKRLRAQRIPADRVARAQSVGVVARAEYLAGDDEARALQVGPGGLIDANLQRVRDRLLVVTPSGWINPRSRSSHKAGLHSFLIRGTSYHRAGLTAGRFSPGTQLRLVREPDNPHDPNAIAVYSQDNKAGYVPASRAKVLAKLMDSGVKLVAVSTRGAAAGVEGVVPQVLVCEQALMRHLQGKAEGG
jgi:hypothetical protein